MGSPKMENMIKIQQTEMKRGRTTYIAASDVVAFVVAIGIVGVTAVARVAATFSQKPLWIVPRHKTSSLIPRFVM